MDKTRWPLMALRNIVSRLFVHQKFNGFKDGGNKTTPFQSGSTKVGWLLTFVQHSPLLSKSTFLSLSSPTIDCSAIADRAKLNCHRRDIG